MIIGDICLVDGRTNLKATDIETDKYEGRKLLRSPCGAEAVLMKSKAISPVTWCVAYRSFGLYFLSYHDAMDYCRKHGFKDEHGKAL